jgi:hypothetical protein
MKPGDLVSITRFDETMMGVYLGPGSGSLCRFLICGEIKEVNLNNKYAYRYRVICG